MGDNANRHLGINLRQQVLALKKLSSGVRINTSSDDASGMAVSEVMRAQISSLQKASENSQMAISLVQVADGALAEMNEVMAKIRELTIAAMSDSYSTADREKFDLEAQELKAEIDSIAEYTEFNTMKLLGGGETDANDVSGDTIAANTAANDLATSIIGASSEEELELEVIVADIEKMIDAMYDLDDDTINKMGFEALITNYFNDYGNSGLSSDYGNSADFLDRFYELMEHKNVAGDIKTDVTDAYNSLVAAINAVKSAANNPGESTSFDFQIGASANQTMTITIEAMDAASLGIDGFDLLTSANASSALDDIDEAINLILAQRAVLGAVESRLEHTIRNVDNTSENVQMAESIIRDTDAASEMVNYTKYSILVEASLSMVMQSTQVPENILKLLE